MHQQTSPAIPSLLHRIQSLTHRPQRDSRKRFFIEGVRNFIQAADAHYPFESILYSPILLQSTIADTIARRLHAAGIPRHRLTPEQFRSISTTERASGIAAILHQRWTPLTDADPRRGLCWLIAEYIRSPGNLGTILRTAEACSASGIIFLGQACDPHDPAAIRASMGGLFHLPLIRSTHRELARWAHRHGILLVGLSPTANLLWTELPAAIPRNAPIALIIGEERRGLSPELLQNTHTTVKLPMTGRADSLNVSIATAIMLYELVRRSVTSHPVRAV